MVTEVIAAEKNFSLEIPELYKPLLPYESVEFQ